MTTDGAGLTGTQILGVLLLMVLPGATGFGMLRRRLARAGTREDRRCARPGGPPAALETLP